MTALSPHFTLAEMERSQAAARLGIVNRMPPAALTAMQALVRDVLDPLRTRLGCPIHVTSGYRSPALNARIGGAATSQHTKGEAVDIEVAGMDTTDLVRFIVKSGLPFDQLIDEAAPDGWVHLSYRAPSPSGTDRNRREVLRAEFKGGKARYSPLRV